MKKEDLLQEEIENILLGIEFIGQYQNLSDSYANSDMDFQYSSEQVLEISEEYGVVLNVFEGGQYFSEYEQIGGFEFIIGITIKYNVVEFDLTIRNESQGISSCGSFGFLFSYLQTGEFVLESRDLVVILL